MGRRRYMYQPKTRTEDSLSFEKDRKQSETPNTVLPTWLPGGARQLVALQSLTNSINTSVQLF